MESSCSHDIAASGECSDLCWAVLDALDSQVVILDATGSILKSNAAWCGAVGSDAAALVDAFSESNYIEACRRRLEAEPALRRLLGGVRGVLGGVRPDFRCEIRRGGTHSRTRWFEVTIRPVGGGLFVAFHNDITLSRDCDRRILEAGDYERAQIGRELHDGLSQVLGGLTLSIAVLASALKKSEAPQAAEAARLVEVARLASAQTRELSAGLHANALESRGLAEVLRGLVERLNDRVPTTVDCPADLEPDFAAAGILYRAVKDILSIASRQPSLESLRLKIRPKQGCLAMTVSSRGVSPSVLVTRGLVNRMRGAGARLNPRGVTLRCVFPPG